jgi:hypothetical protein
VSCDIVAKTLDELFFKLDKTWAESIKNEPPSLLYFPKGLQANFLKDTPISSRLRRLQTTHRRYG